MMPKAIDLTYFAKIVREESVQLRNMLEYNEQADWMLNNALSGFLLARPTPTMHNFLSKLREVLKKSKNLNENMLKNMMSIVFLLQDYLPDDETDPPDPSGGNETAH